MTPCSIDGCDSPVRARGWCSKHHSRWLRNGRLDLETHAERFWAKVDKTAPGGCWAWTGGRNDDGYGIAVVAKETQRNAHRVAYEWLVGPVPEGLVLDHLCRVRHCVNPEHLEPVTQQENVQRYTRTITACRQGHEFTPENTRTYGGKRQCRTCANARRAHLKRKARGDTAG